MSFSKPTLAFAVPACLGRVFATSSSSSSWTCQRPAHSRVAPPSRSASMVPTCCTAAATGKEEQADEVLDEAAMRAAEIHEVLDGLEGFRQRIIDGTFSAL